jgi:PH domain
MLDGSSRRLLDGSSRHMHDGSMSNVGGVDAPVVTATPVDSDMPALAAMNDSSHMFQEQTPFQQGIDYPMRVHGYLWKLDKIKGWKRRFFVLYGEGGVYQMTYSDSPTERVKGTIDNITMGVSTVAETNKSIKKPFSFVLHVDPLQHNGQVLYAAAPSAEEFRKWMNALKAATIRPEDIRYMSHPILSSDAQLESDMEMARRLQAASSGDLNYDPDQDAQIESDHVLAMRMQIQNAPNQAFA